MTQGTNPPGPPPLRRPSSGHRLSAQGHSEPAQPDRRAHQRIDETNRLLAARIDEVNRRIDETNRLLTARIDADNRSLVEQIQGVNTRMDTYFRWITTVLVIGGILIAVIDL